jgi:hypothetical protein
LQGGAPWILVGHVVCPEEEKLQYSHETILFGQYLQPVVNTSHERATVLVFFPPITTEAGSEFLEIFFLSSWTMEGQNAFLINF